MINIVFEPCVATLTFVHVSASFSAKYCLIRVDILFHIGYTMSYTIMSTASRFCLFKPSQLV